MQNDSLYRNGSSNIFSLRFSDHSDRFCSKISLSSTLLLARRPFLFSMTRKALVNEMETEKCSAIMESFWAAKFLNLMKNYYSFYQYSKRFTQRAVDSAVSAQRFLGLGAVVGMLATLSKTPKPAPVPI